MNQFNENFTTSNEYEENESESQGSFMKAIEQFSNSPEASQNSFFVTGTAESFPQLDEQSQSLNQENDEENINNFNEEITSMAKNNNTHRSKTNIVNQNENQTNYQSNGLISTDVSTKKPRNDNLLNSAGSSCLFQIYVLLNQICEKYKLSLKRPNFQKLFCNNNNYHLQFINAKIYQIFIHNCPYNEEIIRRIVKEFKDKVFINIVNRTFEFIYKKYIEEETDNIICLNENNINIEIKTLSQVVNERKAKMKYNEYLSEDKIVEKISTFEEISKNFLIEIKGGGKLIPRKNAKPPKFKFKILSYIENYF